MLQMPVLTTDRLLVRPLTLTDLSALHAVYGDETEAQRDERDAWLCWTVAGYRQYGLLYQPPYGERAVVLRETGELVGVAGLVPSLGPFGRLPGMGREELSPVERARFTPEVGLYWHVRLDQRGRGYATEAGAALIRYALGPLQLRRVVATTEHDNLASQGVMQKLGMRLERNPDPEPAWLQVVGVVEA